MNGTQMGLEFARPPRAYVMWRGQGWRRRTLPTAGHYFKWFEISFVISNMDTCFLPSNTASSFASALIMRRFAGSCRLCFLMYSHTFFVTSVRGMGSEPTTSASVLDGVTGFMKPAFGLLSYFAAVAMTYSENSLNSKNTKPRIRFLGRGLRCRRRKIRNVKRFYPTSVSRRVSTCGKIARDAVIMARRPAMGSSRAGNLAIDFLFVALAHHAYVLVLFVVFFFSV